MTTTPAWFCRPSARLWRPLVPQIAKTQAGAPAFHAELPGYRPTELTELPALAKELGVGRVFVKDESTRMGLGAFKVLGASWAIARLLTDQEEADRTDEGEIARVSLGELRRAAAAHPVELVTATDGNHGRAVAWTARLLGLEARVFVPQVVSERARAAIAAEGGTVIVSGGSYDEAVEEAAAYADEQGAGTGRRLVQDTAWAGYESVPSWIVEGYGTLLAEVDQQFAGRELAGPDLVSVPVGVGSLAQAVVTHYRRGGVAPAVLAVEPETAAGVLASLRAEARRSVPTAETVMAGLNCGTPSSLAWPVLAGGLDAAIAVADQQATEAGADLGRLGVRSGPSGAASLAGVRAALTGPGAGPRRAGLGVTTSSVVLLLSTEGAGRNGGI
ncbi:MAG TPA: diaminopropionate ammonia-lyase [Streptosporangiaceae bacterium]|nr:diaminopropionate ammonia-lyase [Streptosporangiaceae bacterium]